MPLQGPLSEEAPTAGAPSRTQPRSLREAGRGQKAHLGSVRPHRDAQRVEELCAKNQQLREQQKALKENVRALENR